MTKSELIARLAQRYPQLVAKDTEYAVKMVLDAMTHALLSGSRIEIRGRCEPAELAQLKAKAAAQPKQPAPIKTMTGGVQQTDKGWIVPEAFGAPPSIKRA